MKQETLPLNLRHVAQIVRRNMITKVTPSGKEYSRKKLKNVDIFSE
jgi:hypothetical protein